MAANTCIRDLHDGKLDARDEMTTNKDGLDGLLRSFVMPPNFRLSDLVEGSNFLISGYKGTGKTALQLYLSNYFKQLDPVTVTSFILFKTGFDNRKRETWADLMSVKREGLESVSDFTAIWRWHIFQKFIIDNANGALFEEDAAWDRFTSLVLSMLPPKKRSLDNFIKPGSKLVFGIPFLEGIFTPQMEITYKADAKEEKINFYDRVEEATEAFLELTRTDTPYILFLDELEAFYGKDEIFHRDLRIIRDLLTEAKALNGLFYEAGFALSDGEHPRAHTKIICAVRREIINSIDRFIETEELNKVLDGYDCPLIWEARAVVSFRHPIMKVFLKRIELAEQARGVHFASQKELYNKWFPAEQHQAAPVHVILNSGWNKPRDIVRLISVAKNGEYSDSEAFTTTVLNSCMQDYSSKSLTELTGEMKALYSTEETDAIFDCLTGFCTVFTGEELRDHVRSCYPQHEELLFRALPDLFRLGIIGNLLRDSFQYRWHYRGDVKLLPSNDRWLYCIHKGLHKVLSLYPPAFEVREDTPTEECDDVFLLSDLRVADGGLQGTFDGNAGFLPAACLDGFPPEMFLGGTLRVCKTDPEQETGPFELEPADAQILPPCEMLLSQLERSPTGGVRGVLTWRGWQAEGSVSPTLWKALKVRTAPPVTPYDVKLRVTVQGRNSIGDRFALTPIAQNPVIYPAASAPALLGQVVTLRNIFITQRGIKGTLENGLEVTVSARRLQAAGITDPSSCESLRVRIAEKNALGNSYSAFPVTD